jgi:hypothetical protein
VEPWNGIRGTVERDPWNRGTGSVEPWNGIRGTVERDPWNRGTVERDPWNRGTGSVEPWNRTHTYICIHLCLTYACMKMYKYINLHTGSILLQPHIVSLAYEV